jgi:hypothetical protein
MGLVRLCGGCGERLPDDHWSTKTICLNRGGEWPVREVERDHYLNQLRRDVEDLASAVRLLNDAQTTIIDTDLRREWEAERARLRTVGGQ